ncbi:MAG: prefoldin subunit alpha [Nanoarchaeota archaeon]|nr:prefoldin subunit alpha [Nanoarchaeota archaeon]MBU1135169.1 prefoldin subunit alpha [Nanoarchaeota archaeon]MBU2520142.1 prefoldin subunit alpha [Nanoarchaeota archaeon]
MVKPNSKQQDMQEKVLMYQLMQNHIEQLRQQLMAVEREFLEIDGTINAVETISTNKIDNDSFVPLGTGCFVKSSINSKNNFLINIGAGIFVNKKTAEAVEFLEEMKTEREKLLNKIKNEFDSTMGKINDVGKEISAMQQ